MRRAPSLRANRAVLASVALWCGCVLAETDVSDSAVASDQVPHSGQDENSTFSWRRIELSGVSRSQLPFFVEDADVCRTACTEQRDCVGWMFRVSQLRCFLFTGRLSVRECDTHDCIAGLIVDRLKDDVEPLVKEIEDIINVPSERYRGLGLTCKEKSRYTSVSAVLAACGQVLRHCAPAAQEIERVSLPSVKCVSDEIMEDRNLYWYDFNNGFEEVVLSPEDCCRKCMEAKKCVAWTKTATGQCWLKFHAPGDNVKELIGDVSGLRPKLKVKCGQRFNGITYEMENPDFEMVTENITNADQCCQLCTEKHECHVWSYFPLDKKCVRILGFDGVKTKHPNVTTSFMVTVPEKCDNNRSKDETSAEDIAAAYHPKCSAILKFGPKERRPGCQERQDAITFFTESYERIRRVI